MFLIGHLEYWQAPDGTGGLVLTLTRTAHRSAADLPLEVVIDTKHLIHKGVTISIKKAAFAAFLSPATILPWIKSAAEARDNQVIWPDLR